MSNSKNLGLYAICKYISSSLIIDNSIIQFVRHIAINVGSIEDQY